MLAPDLIDAELSLLAFQWRVLALAEDASTPLLERLRFLGILTSNLDELYMVRLAELRRAAVEEQAGREVPAVFDALAGGSHTARLAAIESQLAALIARQSQCALQCLGEAAEAGVGLVTWHALTPEEQEALRWRYLQEIQPDLMTHAITLSPGHPLPHLPHLGLFVAIVYRAGPGERARLAEHELPTDVPRLLPVPGRAGAVIAVEELLRVFAHRLYPNAVVEGAHLFRVTRGGELPVHESDATDLLDAVAWATERRPLNPAVRVEVERGLSDDVARLILDSLHREALGRDREITVTEPQVIDGLLDLRCLSSLPLPRGTPFEYAAITPRSPFAPNVSIMDQLHRGDVLAHHPFEAFDDTVVRFFTEAAHDPAVTAIGATLYRVGDPSPIVQALLDAAAAGKRVFAFVELQARFDEAHNVRWARLLERAGGRVVYGMPGLKVHAKVALVERREGETLRQYAHVGTGNYNPRSGRQYTDVSLFSSRRELTGDVQTLLAVLRGEIAVSEVRMQQALVSPAHLLAEVLQRIDRETQHAAAGRPAAIAIKVNGLADTEVVRALYRASQAGVQIELIVRGICTLRPGVPGLSDRIRVVSAVGRWLEHSRVYRFANGGEPEYFIGSADLRPRNLRRRVELLVPVVDVTHRATLDALLAHYLRDPCGWTLRPDGTYAQSPSATSAAAQQQYFVTVDQ